MANIEKILEENKKITEKQLTIEYLGKTYNVFDKEYTLLSDEEYEKILRAWYNKPNFDNVRKEFGMILDDSIMMPNITKYYFRELMDNTIKYNCHWSINEVLANKLLTSIIVYKTTKNEKVFTNDNIIDRMDTQFRIGGSPLASKAGQFPIKTAVDILDHYNINNNWYDFSCGWGARLCTALGEQINYFGTDPNYLLVEKLNELYNDFRKYQFNHIKADIRCQGSEVFVPEWENKIGLAFSSPPYFKLENYRVGEQSCSDDTDYSDWLEGYYKPTMRNIHKYLIDDGFMIVNIKDYGKYTLEADTIKCAEECGFELYNTERLEQGNRYGGSNEHKKLEKAVKLNSNENIYVFRKAGSNAKKQNDYQFGGLI